MNWIRFNGSLRCLRAARPPFTPAESQPLVGTPLVNAVSKAWFANVRQEQLAVLRPSRIHASFWNRRSRIARLLILCRKSMGTVCRSRRSTGKDSNTWPRQGRCGKLSIKYDLDQRRHDCEPHQPHPCRQDRDRTTGSGHEAAPGPYCRGVRNEPRARPRGLPPAGSAGTWQSANRAVACGSHPSI